MNDRKMIKWIPFDSVINSQIVANNLSKEKENITMPILSEEQILDINNKIIDSYNLNQEIIINYFKNNKVNKITSKIKKIDIIKKRIILTNNSYIYFNQIIYINSNYSHQLNN